MSPLKGHYRFCNVVFCSEGNMPAEISHRPLPQAASTLPLRQSHPPFTLDGGAGPAQRHPCEHVDLYARLGLAASPPPSAADIRLAYRALILQAHPDRAAATTTSGATVQDQLAGDVDAREVNEAWEVLADEESRAAYDAARRGEYRMPSS